MYKPKLIRITTIPLSLEKLLEGQLSFMSKEYDVVAVSSEKERLEVYGEKEGIRVFPVELTRKITPLKDILAVIKLYRFLKSEKPDIVHTHTPKAGIVGMMASWLAGVPNRLHTVAGLPLMESAGIKRNILNAVEKLTYCFATKVYPNSQGLYDFILSEKFTTPEKLSIIGKGSSNGIDTDYFDPGLYTIEDRNEMRKKLGIPLENFVFIFVGRLVQDKGINELVSAFKKLVSTKKNISLLLVGPMEEQLDPLSEVTLTEIANNAEIYSVGYQEDVRPYFSLANALVFPSYREGFPNVVMQAGAMGLPAIVTNINGCNEIIQENINGVLILVKNENDLQSAMEMLITQPLKYKNLHLYSRRIIVERYRRQEIWDALLTEYKSL